jgi:hypothetical protein
LKKVSPEFIQGHPNPYIKLFIDLAASPNVSHPPIIDIWFEYQDEVVAAFDMIIFGLDSPENALDKAQARVSAMWQRSKAAIARRAEAEKERK